MTTHEHEKYLQDFKDLTEKILESEEESRQFLIDAKINTPKGRLTKYYSRNSTTIGYKSNKSE